MAEMPRLMIGADYDDDNVEAAAAIVLLDLLGDAAIQEVHTEEHADGPEQFVEREFHVRYIPPVRDTNDARD